MNGARGVIINITGGPDLSLVEVSEASSIVQEAADEDANIIFGAVVDPALKGKVKITVIATGFGAYSQPPGPPASAAQTPVDMTQYNDGGRMRTEPAAVAPAAAVERLTLRRLAGGRRAMDLPLSVTGNMAAGSGAAAGGATTAAAQPDEPDSAASASDEDVNPAFDVPAFLRRQEG